MDNRVFVQALVIAASVQEFIIFVLSAAAQMVIVYVQAFALHTLQLIIVILSQTMFTVLSKEHQINSILLYDIFWVTVFLITQFIYLILLVGFTARHKEVQVTQVIFMGILACFIWNIQFTYQFQVGYGQTETFVVRNELAQARCIAQQLLALISI